MPDRPTGTVTFLFTDIQGSTKLWQDCPEQMRPALARHEAIMRRCIEERGGYVFKTVGDAFCAAFATAPDAVQATLTAQLALSAEAWDLPTPLLVRMGLHTGSAEERDGDYFGPVVNRVARLMSVGYGGQVLLSAATQELVRDQLPTDADLRDLGLASLKDLGRPERVSQLLHPALPADFAPLKSLDNPALPNNLPQQATSFIGREKEVTEIKDRLGKTRLLTLIGTGGAGKTRLSLQAAADLLDGDGDGVWLVELAAITDPALVPQAVAGVLGVREEAGKPLARTLTEFLKSKRLLLILDNCEHLVVACAALAADLLRSCADVYLLVSSRERLGVPGEQIYRVPALSVPNPKDTPTLAVLTQYEAVRLFTERAQAVQPSFTVTDANAPAVAQVCWRLDGIPLALELAAARVRSLPVEEVNARLDNRFRLLTGGSRTLLPRQQTLRALVDWSYDLLNECEQTLFARLSVFAGGWTLEAAEAVCAGDAVEDWEVLDLLTSLSDKSLVVYEEEGASSRYRLLETVRQYAAERLTEGGTGADVRGCHRDYYLALAEQADPLLGGPEQGAWLSRLETDHDNLRAALSWCEAENETGKAEGGEAWLRLCAALGRFWEVRCHYSEGRQWLERALEQTKGLAATPARARALTRAGNLAHEQGDIGAARALHEQSLEISRQTGESRGVADALHNLGNVAYMRADFGAARTLFEESLGLRRQNGDERGAASSLTNLGNIAQQQADFGAAHELYEESLSLFRRMGDQRGSAGALEGLAGVAYFGGDFGASRALFEESLDIKRSLGDLGGIANALTNLGSVVIEQGDLAAARTFLVQGLELHRQIKDLWGGAYALEALAGVSVSQGHAAHGTRLWGAADALRDRLGTPLSPQDREREQQQKDQARQALGAEAYLAAFAGGRALTWEQAVAEALGQRLS